MDRIHLRRRKPLGLAIGVSLLSPAAASAGKVTVWCRDPNFNGATMKEAEALVIQRKDAHRGATGDRLSIKAGRAQPFDSAGARLR